MFIKKIQIVLRMPELGELAPPEATEGLAEHH
jgi:hypothetical protein